MRERTTWNRAEIKTAAMPKKADPYLMNQDHVGKQPPANKYLTGDPSSFAEDVHKPDSWDVEYANGQTKRDEIGMPEKRPETYTHPEKTASTLDEKALLKKADLCGQVARMMLAGRKYASTEAQAVAIEDQAVALMHMPDAALIETTARLAGQFGEDQAAAVAMQQQQAAQQQQAQQQQQLAQCQQQYQTAAQQGDQKGMETALQQMVDMKAAQQQQVLAAKKANEEQGQQQTQQTQEKQAQNPGAAPAASAAPAPAAPAATTAAPSATMVPLAEVQRIVEAALKKANDEQQQQAAQQQQQAQQQAQQAAQQAQQAAQQAQQAQQQAQQAQQGQPQQQTAIPNFEQAQQQQPVSNDQLLDEMLMGPGGEPPNDMGIELEAAPMDVGEVVLSAEDEVLKTLFATEESQAQEAQQEPAQGQQKQGGMTRTASTRTIGTKPTGGVSRVGGTPSGGAGGGEVDKLAGLWPSAPDVKAAFNM